MPAPVQGEGLFPAGFQGLPDRDRLTAAAKELESVVISQLLSTMRNTVPEGGLFEKSAADDIFRSMLDTELARVASEKSPFGLAEKIVEQLESGLVKGTEAPAEPGATAAPARSWRA